VRGMRGSSLRVCQRVTGPNSIEAVRKAGWWVRIALSSGRCVQVESLFGARRGSGSHRSLHVQGQRPDRARASATSPVSAGLFIEDDGAYRPRRRDAVRPASAMPSSASEPGSGTLLDALTLVKTKVSSL
jgi:hypothetical protein